MRGGCCCCCCFGCLYCFLCFSCFFATSSARKEIELAGRFFFLVRSETHMYLCCVARTGKVKRGETASSWQNGGRGERGAGSGQGERSGGSHEAQGGDKESQSPHTHNPHTHDPCVLPLPLRPTHHPCLPPCIHARGHKEQHCTRADLNQSREVHASQNAHITFCGYEETDTRRHAKGWVTCAGRTATRGNGDEEGEGKEPGAHRECSGQTPAYLHGLRVRGWGGVRVCVGECVCVCGRLKRRICMEIDSVASKCAREDQKTAI